jgi:hypothetical protein
VSRSVNDLEYTQGDVTGKSSGVHTVTMYLGVSNFQRAISIVIPRSRSAFSLSSTHATECHQLCYSDLDYQVAHHI